MRTYVFFNKDTGEILHTHHEVALTGDSLSVAKDQLLTGDVMRLLEDRIDTQNVDVLEVEENSHLIRRSFSEDDEVALYVDVEKRILSERERNARAGE